MADAAAAATVNAAAGSTPAVAPAAAVAVSQVWKIFGSNAAAAFAAVRTQGLSKQAVLEQYNCVIGVADVSFRVSPGEIYCIMGLSGSGKSTLVRHINRLLEPTAGAVSVNGVNVLALDAPALQAFRNRHIAMVFQNFALMPHRSVLDNIAMPLEIRGVGKNERTRAAEENLQRVELDGWGNKFAHELSGGMQQRIGLARALASDPDILLMDEPFSALDPLIRRQLQDQFLALRAQMQKTTIFITHDLDEAVRIGDKIAIMRDGRIVQEGTPEEIVLHPADAYVADFVAGIPRLKVVAAHAIMTPLAVYEQAHGAVGADAPQFADDTPLARLVAAAVDNDTPLVITDSHGARAGVVDRKSLLQAVADGGD